MTQQAKTVIVGGGIWGLSTAYHLAWAGETDVHVLERNGELFSETTSQAAGLVGQIRANSLMIGAVQYSINLLRDFEEQTGHDPGFHQVGSLLIASTPERMTSFEQHVEYANKEGVEARFVDGVEMSRLAPHMDVSRIEGGYFVPEDGYLEARKFAEAMGAAAKDLGAKIRTGISVTDLLVKDGRVVGVETEAGPVEAERVVVTAGPWTGAIAKMVGYEPAMVPIRHQRVTTAPVEGIPNHHPVIRVTDASCYVRPENGGYLYGIYEPEPASYDLDLPTGFHTADIKAPVEIMDEARDRLAPIFPVLDDLPIDEHKRGLTTFAPDGAYLVGPVPGFEGLFFATGCASLGIAGSAAVGRWLANWALKGEPGEDLSKFDPERFSAKSQDREWVRRKSEEFYGGYYSIASMNVS